MKVNRKLNIVIPVDLDDGKRVFVHAIPISSAVFDEHFFVLAKVFAGIYAGGLDFHTGPRVAMLMLKRISDQLGVWDEVREGLVAEIHRGIVVIVPGVGQVSWDEAVAKYLSPDDVSEVDNAITFFIVASAMHKKSELLAHLEGAARLWSAQIISSSATEYENISRISTEAESGGATVKV